MQDTNEKLRLTCGSLQRIATDHVRVPSPMIGQYTLDLRVNSIRDTGTGLIGLSSHITYRGHSSVT